MPVKTTMTATEVMQFESRPYTGKDGKQHFDRSMVVKYQNKLFMFKVAQTLPDNEAQALVGKKVDLDFEVSTFGASLEATFRVAGVKASK